MSRAFVIGYIISVAGIALCSTLRGLGFNPTVLVGTKGFSRIKGLADAVEADYSSDETKQRFEILARQVLICFKALLSQLVVDRDRTAQEIAPDRERGRQGPGVGR